MFNIDVLSNQNINTQNVFESTAVEETYVLSTLKFLEEYSREYTETSKILYRSILESGSDMQVVNESFSDFFAKVKELIDKFIKFIKSLFDRFMTALNRFVLSEKYLTKHKDEFKKFADKHDFRMEGYKFTIDPNIPLVEAEATFDQDFVKLNFTDLAKFKGDQVKMSEEIGKKYSALTAELKGERYDYFRGKVIGKDNYPITAGEFANELFTLFRDDSSSKDTIDVNSTEVLYSLGRFENFKEFEKTTKKLKDTIEREYESIKKKVQSMVYRNKDNDINKLIGITVADGYNSAGSLVVSNDVMTKIDLFVKVKVNEIVQLSNIHSLAFSYKLDAIADCYRQDKQLLYMALSRIQKDLKA